MNKQASISIKKYTGCYNCSFFERIGNTISGYGKCKKPLKEALFHIDIKYIENGTFSYPDKYYPTAGICCIDNCENWEAIDVR